VKSLDIDGRKIPVEVDGDGRFYASYDKDSDRLWADSRAELERRVRLKLRTKALRVDVPVTLLTGSSSWHRREKATARDARLTGINAGNGNPIIVDQDGKIEKRDYDHLCRRLTVAEKGEYIAQHKAKDAAQAQIEKFEHDWQINANEAVRVAAGLKPGSGNDADE
jgi:hypothetical protein